MPVPVREQILASITATFDAVFGIGAPEPKDDLPAAAVRDLEDSASAVYGRTNLETQVEVVRLEKAASLDKNAMRAQCNTILAFLVSEMHANTTLAALVDGVEFSRGLIDADGDICLAQAVFTIRWHHVAGDPYTIDED